MSSARRAVLVLGVLVGVLLVAGLLLAPRAYAQDAGGGDDDDCVAAKVGLPCAPSWGEVLGTGELLDSLCPRVVAPVPQAPSGDGPALVAGVPEVEQGLYARYRYAGLRWTTYDQGCIDTSRIDTGVGSGLDGAATAVDAMVNQLQTYALDVDSALPYDGMLTDAIARVGGAFWNEWTAVGLALAGLVFGVLLVSGNASASLGGAAATVLLLGAVTWVVANPTVIPRYSDAATTGVVSRSSSAMVAATGGSGALPAEHVLPETYYRVSYQAWLQGMFCGDTRAEADFGWRFLDAQAWSVSEWAAVNADPGSEVRRVEGKQIAWLTAAAELQKKYPTAFACWSGETNERVKAASKHAVVTVLAGSVVSLMSGTVAVLRNVLRIGLVLAVAFGAAMLFSRRVTSGFVEILVLGAVGAPAVALASSTVLFAFSAILRDPNAAWWQSVMAALFLAVGLLVLRRPLARIVTGLGSVDVGRGAARRARRAASSVTSDLGSRRSAAASAAVAGAAGAAAAAVGDGPRGDAEPAGDGSAPARPVRASGDDRWLVDDDGPPAGAVPAPRGADRPYDWAASGLDWADEDGGPVRTGGGDDELVVAQMPGTRWTPEQEAHVDRAKESLRGWRERAVERGTPPTGYERDEPDAVPVGDAPRADA